MKRLSDAPQYSQHRDDLAKAHSAKTDFISARLGVKMMSGWTMTNKHCAECHCPIMKKADETVCVNCDEPDEEPSQAPPAKSVAVGEPAAGKDSEMQLEAGASPASSQTSETSLPAAVDSSDAQQGAEAADDDDEDDQAAIEKRLLQAMENKPASALDKLHSDSKVEDTRSNDACAKMGELMLKGWAMLNLHCPSPECHTPLLRDKQGKMICVSCGATVITEEEAKQRNLSADGNAAGGGNAGTVNGSADTADRATSRGASRTNRHRRSSGGSGGSGGDGGGSGSRPDSPRLAFDAIANRPQTRGASPAGHSISAPASPLIGTHNKRKHQSVMMLPGQADTRKGDIHHTRDHHHPRTAAIAGVAAAVGATEHKVDRERWNERVGEVARMKTMPVLSRLEEAILFQLRVVTKTMGSVDRTEDAARLTQACQLTKELLQTLGRLHAVRQGL